MQTLALERASFEKIKRGENVIEDKEIKQEKIQINNYKLFNYDFKDKYLSSLIQNLKLNKNYYQYILFEDNPQNQIYLYEGKLNNINCILNNSMFIIYKYKLHCGCHVKYKKRANLTTFEELLLYINNLKSENPQEKTIKEVEKIIMVIKEIYDLIKKISLKGYPKEYLYQIVIQNKDILIYAINGITTAEALILKLTREYNEINEMLINWWKKKYINTFIYGKIFYYFTVQNDNQEKKLFNFLKFISSHNKNYSIIADNINGKIEPSLIFKVFNNNLSQIISEYKLHSHEVTNKIYLKHIYSYQIKDNYYEEPVLNTYITLTNFFPKSQVILIIKNNTTNEELISFLYRSLYCPYKYLFALVIKDTKNTEKVKIIKDILQNNEIKSSTLVIFYSETCDIIVEILNLCRIPSIENKIINQDKKITLILSSINDVSIYYSKSSGTGKTSLIMDEVGNEKLEYIYFPIYSDFSYIHFKKLLKQSKIRENNTLIHIDLKIEKTTPIINDFLFSFIILKYYSLNENIIFSGDKGKIRIEMDYNIKFPIDKYIVKKDIGENCIDNFDASKLFISKNTQLVCTYIYLLLQQEITNKATIYIEEISKDRNDDNIFEIKDTLGKDECKQLISRYLKNKNSNYYQICNFINILAHQLKSFNTSRYLSNDLIVNAIENLDLRKKINDFNFKSFFLSTLIDTSQYYLNNEQICSDDIKNFFVFCEDGQEFYLENSKNDLHNFKILLNSKNFINLNEAKSSDILIKVKALVNFFEPKAKKGIFKEITKSFAFTKDNYIKMILIKLRLRAKIPIILLGESGTGKTSLIKMVNKLDDNKLITKKIKPSTNIFDIIEQFQKKDLFISDSDNKDKDLEEDETNIYFFFDSITNNNLNGVLLDIITRHSILGKKIKKNVVIIASYTIDKNSHFAIPDNLKAFTLNFGRLKDETMNRYIEEIIEQYIDNLQLDQTNQKLKSEIINLLLSAFEIFRGNNEYFSLHNINLFLQLTTFINTFFYKAKKDSYTQSFYISFYICFYLHFNTRLIRYLILSKFNELTNNKFSNTYNQIQNAFISKFKLPKGIQCNSILKEILFSLFVCINSKCPIFLIGKPGSGKTLSFRLLYREMIGSDSTIKEFKNLPWIYLQEFKGGYLNSAVSLFSLIHSFPVNNEEMLPVLLYEGMDYDDNSTSLDTLNCYIESNYFSFVGTMTKILNHSVINKGIIIKIPDPEIEDIKDNNIPKSVNLAIGYHNYYIKNNNNEHSLRDYYNTLRLLREKVNYIKEKNEFYKEFEKLIELNFGGKINEIPFKRELGFNNIRYNIHLSLENKKEFSKRFLMIFTPFLQFAIREFNDYLIFYPSEFENDKKDEVYLREVSMFFKNKAEEGEKIILINSQYLFPYLLDFLEKNNENNSAKIYFNSKSFNVVHFNEQFQLINIITDNKESLRDLELSRFYKHSLQCIETWDVLNFTNEIKKVSNEILNNTNSLPNIKLYCQLVNFNDDRIEEILDYSNRILQRETHQCIHLCLKNMTKLFSQDIIVSLKNNNQIFKVYCDSSFKEYRYQNHSDFSEFLSRFNEQNWVIITFSNIFSSLKREKIINNKTYGIFNKNSIIELEFCQINNERELKGYLEKYYLCKEFNLLIIKFLQKEIKFVQYVKYLNDLFIQEYKYDIKPIIFTIHITRVLKNEATPPYTLSFSWYLFPNQIFIDNLIDDNPNIYEYINASNSELARIVNKNELIKEEITNFLNVIEFKFLNKSMKKDKYIQEILKGYNENQNKREIISQCILKNIKKENKVTDLILRENFDNFDKTIDLFSLMKRKLEDYMRIHVKKLLKRSQKDGVLYYFLTQYLKGEELSVLEDYFLNLSLKEEKINFNKNIEIFIIETQIPLSQLYFNQIYELSDLNVKTFARLQREARFNRDTKEEIDKEIDLLSKKLNFKFNNFQQAKVHSDFIKIFLSERHNDNFHLEESILLILIEHFYSKDNLIGLIFWLKTNEEIIFAICNFVICLKKYNKNIVNMLKSKINDKINKWEKSLEGTIIKKNLNRSFYFILNGIIYIIIDFLYQKNFKDYLNLIPELFKIVNECIQIDSYISLLLKIGNIQLFFKLLTELCIQKDESKLQIFFSISKKDKIQQFDIFTTYLRKTPKNYRLLSLFLTEIFKNAKKQKDKEDIMIRFLNDCSLLSKSHHFLQLILNEKNKRIIEKLNNRLLKFTIEEILFETYEIQIFPTLSLNKEDRELFNQHLEKIKDYNNINHIDILYSLCFVKCFLYFVLKKITSVENNERNEIFKSIEIKLKNKKILKTLQLFILKEIKFIGIHENIYSKIKIINKWIKKFYQNPQDYVETVLFLTNNFENIKFTSKLNKNDFDENPISFIYLYNYLVNQKLKKKEISIKEDHISTIVSNETITNIFNYLIQANFNNNKKYSLYSLKLYLFCALSEKNSFFSSLISPNVATIIDSNLIPGQTNNQILINSYRFIEDIFYYDPDQGVYLCSCGKYYTEGQCGFPCEILICDNCHQEIGGKEQKLVEREGHVRVYKDEQMRKMKEKKSNWINYSPPYKYLKDIKKEIEQLESKEQKGIEPDFSKEYYQVRNLSEISFRLLNFIMYSIINYSNIFGFISQEKMKRYLYKNKNCQEMIEHNWKSLQKALSQKGIGFIEIFLNLILPKIYNNMKNCPLLDDSNKRREFEDNINKTVSSSLEEYNTYMKKFLSWNSRELDIEENSIHNILIEVFDYNQISQNEYPYMRCFLHRNYPNKDNIKEYLNSIEDTSKYPILRAYFFEEEKLKQLKNVIKINPFAQYMLQYYSFSITRNEAKIYPIEVVFNHNNEVIEKYNKFEMGWNKSIGKNDIRFDCHLCNSKKISKNDYIAHCLENKDEFENGMYLAGFYQNMINIQNQFLSTIKFSKNLPNKFKYLNTFDMEKNKIKIQDATDIEIASNISKSKFNQIINSYHYRAFTNGEVNLNKYSKVSYYLDEIEEKIGDIILSGKTFFDEDNVNVTYQYEYNDSSYLLIFNEKYKSTPINKAINFRGGIKDYFLLQFLINYLNIDTFDKKDTLKKVVEYLIKEKKINNIILNEENDGKDYLNEYKIENLFELFEYFEKKAINEIKEHVNLQYKLEKNVKNGTIDEYFKEKRFITKDILKESLRKLISRYLGGQNQNEEFHGKLFNYIGNREDIWPKEIFENGQFEKEIEELQKVFDNVTSKGVFNFYCQLEGELKDDIPLENDYETNERNKEKWK